MTDDHRLLQLVAAVASDSVARLRTASELANYIGADDLLILIPDKDHSFYLPPPGFPQTLVDGRSWRSFAARVTADSHGVAELGYPTADKKRVANAWSTSDGAIVILFDGEPNVDRVQCLLKLMPLIAPTFERERLTIISAAQAKVAAESAKRARELAESLDVVRRQLQTTVILREQDIAAREHVEAELERTNSDLHRVNDDLNQFTFAATHDVREPLRMINIYSQLLEKELGSFMSESAKTYINQVIGGSRRGLRLIDGLLQFTQMGGMQSIETTQVSSQVALAEALADLQLMINESKAKVIHAELPEVLADQLHLRQLFQNLIANAIKYRRPDTTPEIRILAERQGGHWLFTVADNGVGIAPKHYDQVFVPFKRLHGSEISGAGIGLATCKRIVERYGGRIWVESRKDSGAVFCFSLRAREGN
ncbi:MAG: ATP-binding protein [Bryobacteraceae bacterium]